MKKFLTALPIIGLILGAVAIATEIRRPASFLEISPQAETAIERSIVPVHKKSSLSSSRALVVKNYSSRTFIEKK